VDAIWTGQGEVEIEGRRMAAIGGDGGPPGPVRVAISTPDGGYRAAAMPHTRILGRGSVADAREELDARARGAALAAIVVLVLSSTPLLVTAVHRMVV
jgi:hypothetical protein